MERQRNYRLLTLTGVVLIVAGGLVPVRAQEQEDLQRSVARISLMNGEVSVRRGDSGDWVAGVINAPLMADDRIATGPNSRAEVQLDSANIVRVGGGAEVRLTELAYGRYQMELAHGTLTFNVVRASSANAEVDTPSIAVRPTKQGVYRISVNDAGETEVTVRAGEADIYSSRGSQPVQAGQSLLARGNSSDAEFQMVAALPYDDWDRWNADRDRQLAQVASYQYVPQGVYGAEDLDTYGSWQDIQPYGYCWRPTVAVAAGWAPYRSGRWVWEDWYGWTWVSSDPWGWAPYHYGRWFWNANAWWWYPGVMGRPHYWSPALVAFFGFGGGGGIGFGFGNVGWVPLAPYEVFHPWWGRGYYGGGAYINRSVNITNVNITNVYRNARVTNGVSGIGAADFQGGRFHNIRGFQGGQIQQAGLVRGQMPLSPTARNLNFSNRTVGNVPASRGNMQFFSHQQATPVQRVPFAQQQRSFAQAGAPGRSAGEFRPQESMSNTSPRGAQNPGANGWRRFGDASPARTPASGGAPNANTGSRSGWQRFGAPSRTQNQAAPSSSQSNSVGRYSGSRFAGQSERQQPLRVSPQVVRQRENFGSPSQSAPRYQAPRMESQPRSFGAPRMQSQPRSFSAPREQSAPRTQSAPRGGGGGHSGGGGPHGRR